MDLRQVENIPVDQLKEELFHMLIHDMKIPLTFMIGSLQLLQEQKVGNLNREQTDLVNLILRGCRRLENMIFNILDIDRLEEGKIDLHNERVDLKEIVADRIRYWAPIAQKQGKQISWSAKTAHCEIECDRHLLERILENLLSNAVKHTREGSGLVRIEVEDNPTPGFILIRVQDNGEGIPLDYQDRIFNKYAVVASQELGLKSDTGLGLTFCKMATDAMRGKIWVESTPDKGSIFNLELPR